MKTTNDIRHGSFDAVLNDVTADLIVTSPPYNIGSQAPAKTGKRNKKLGTYDPKSYRGIREYADNLPEKEYQAQQVAFLDWAAEHTTDNGVLVYQHKPRRKQGKMIHPIEWLLRCDKWQLMEEIIWDRGSTHNHSNRLMWPHTERLYVLLKKGGKYPLLNTDALDFRADVWRLGKAPTNGHNAPYPEALARATIKAWSKPGQLVCDPYLGSGTTAKAAQDLGRSFVGSEILLKYYRQAIKRAA